MLLDTLLIMLIVLVGIILFPYILAFALAVTVVAIVLIDSVAHAFKRFMNKVVGK